MTSPMDYDHIGHKNKLHACDLEMINWASQIMVKLKKKVIDLLT